VPSDELWDDAEPLADFEGALAVSPTDELLAACLTDGRTASPRSIAWIPDAVLIDRAADVDWERLVRLGVAGGQTLRLRPRLDYVRQLRDEGHEIGNHTWSHPSLSRDCDDAQVRDELERTNDLLTEILGGAPPRFRAPHFDVDERVERVAAELGLRHTPANV